MNLSYYSDNFKIELPIAKSGEFWNGKPDEFNNIGQRLSYSQQFGQTAFSKATGAYEPMLGHNGHDFAGSVGTELVCPCRVFVTHIGWDRAGYGNYVFFETEDKTINGERIKMEFILAHCDKVFAVSTKWYDKGKTLGLMGNTGFSTGPHTHFGGRPLIFKDGKWEQIYKDNRYRGYVDLKEFFITKPTYDKSTLYKQIMKLIKLKGEDDIYAVDHNNRANLILNWDTYQAGLRMGIWEDKTEIVDELPKKGEIIILTPNN